MYFLVLLAERLRSNDTTVAMSTSSAQILVSNTIPPNRAVFLREHLIPWLGQDRYKMNPECFIIPESEEVLKNRKTDGCLSQEYRSQFEGAPTSQIWTS